MSGQFLTPIPAAFLKDAGTAEWARQLTLYLDDLSRPEGVLSASEDTAVIVGVQAVTLTSVQADLDAVEAQLATLRNSLPVYSLAGDVTDRSLNANAASSGTGIDVADAGPANVALLSDHDALVSAVQGIADVLATVIRDLRNKQILGT